MKSSGLLFIIAMILAMVACADQTPVSLTRSERAVLDSLIRAHNLVVKAQIDSQCAVQQEDMVAHLTDSLLKEELKAIERIRQ